MSRPQYRKEETKQPSSAFPGLDETLCSFLFGPSLRFFLLFGRDTLFLSPFIPHHSCRTALSSLHSPPPCVCVSLTCLSTRPNKASKKVVGSSFFCIKQTRHAQKERTGSTVAGGYVVLSAPGESTCWGRSASHVVVGKKHAHIHTPYTHTHSPTHPYYPFLCGAVTTSSNGDMLGST